MVCRVSVCRFMLFPQCQKMTMPASTMTDTTIMPTASRFRRF